MDRIRSRINPVHPEIDAKPTTHSTKAVMGMLRVWPVWVVTRMLEITWPGFVGVREIWMRTLLFARRRTMLAWTDFDLLVTVKPLRAAGLTPMMSAKAGDVCVRLMLPRVTIEGWGLMSPVTEP